ncbi:hypothetical protein HT105_24490, partial [Bacteroides fragilis]|nr:hypothetical protein [Bacteroides fragilis]
PINFTESNVHPVQTGVSAVDPTKKEITGGVSMLLVLVFGFLAMLLLAMTLPYYLRGILPDQLHRIQRPSGADRC